MSDILSIWGVLNALFGALKFLSKIRCLINFYLLKYLLLYVGNQHSSKLLSSRLSNSSENKISDDFMYSGNAPPLIAPTDDQTMYITTPQSNSGLLKQSWSFHAVLASFWPGISPVPHWKNEQKTRLPVTLLLDVCFIWSGIRGHIRERKDYRKYHLKLEEAREAYLQKYKKGLN